MSCVKCGINEHYNIKLEKYIWRTELIFSVETFQTDNRDRIDELCSGSELVENRSSVS